MSDEMSGSTLTRDNYVRINNRHGVQNYKHYDELVIADARGQYVFSIGGARILDGLSSYGAVISHDWSVAKKAFTKCRSGAVSGVVHTPERALFQLAVTNFTGFDRVLAKSGGGEAVETAFTALFTLAMDRGIKDPKIILFDDYFHGRMRSAQTNSNDPDQYEGKGPCVPGFVRVPRTVEAVRSAITADTIGIVLEKHQGEAGPIFDVRGKDSFYAAVHRIAREKGVFIVVDEVQTGLYRCGYKMSWEEDGEECRPDAVVLGKILGGGIVPVSAIVGTDAFMEAFNKPGREGSTFGGYPKACAVATAVLEYMERNPWLGERSEAVGKRFASNLSGIPRVRVDYRGSMIGIEVEDVSSTSAICHEMLTGSCPIFVKNGHRSKRGAFIRVSPPFLAIKDCNIDEVCEKTMRPILARASARAAEERAERERFFGDNSL